MIQVKCKRCGNKNNKDKSYLHIHVTSGGNKQNRYYCNEDCYDLEQNDIYMLKQCQYFIDELFGYTVINNAKNNNIKELCSAGYTREEIYDCMKELESTLADTLNYKKIDDEYAKIQYVFAIIKGKIREITLNNKIDNKNKYTELDSHETIQQVEISKKKTKRVGLIDVL
ncbi:MAG: hypothetical protein ACRCX2_10765 [Paraclostridium sp.]